LRHAVADEQIENCSEKRDVLSRRCTCLLFLADAHYDVALFPQKSHHQLPGSKTPISETYATTRVERDEAGAERVLPATLRSGLPGRSHYNGRCRAPERRRELYREEKYAAVLRDQYAALHFCGSAKEACPKEAIFLTDRIVQTDFERNDLVYGKDKTGRRNCAVGTCGCFQTPDKEVPNSKHILNTSTTKLWDPNKSLQSKMPALIHSRK